MQKKRPSWHSANSKFRLSGHGVSSPALTEQQGVCSEALGLRPTGRATRQRQFSQEPLERAQSKLVSRMAVKPAPAAHTPARGWRDLGGFVEVVNLTVQRCWCSGKTHDRTLHWPIHPFLQPAIARPWLCVRPSARHWGHHVQWAVPGREGREAGLESQGWVGKSPRGRVVRWGVTSSSCPVEETDNLRQLQGDDILSC